MLRHLLCDVVPKLKGQQAKLKARLVGALWVEQEPEKDVAQAMALILFRSVQVPAMVMALVQRPG